MAQSVKFAADALINDARIVAEIQSRSLASQITHWARIGGAVKRSVGFDYAKLLRVLAGEFETTVLTAKEKAVGSEQFLARMSEPGPKEDTFFAELCASGKAVGLDTSGKIVTLDASPEA